MREQFCSDSIVEDRLQYAVNDLDSRLSEPSAREVPKESCHVILAHVYYRLLANLRVVRT